MATFSVFRHGGLAIAPRSLAPNALAGEAVHTCPVTGLAGTSSATPCESTAASATVLESAGSGSSTSSGTSPGLVWLATSPARLVKDGQGPLSGSCPDDGRREAAAPAAASAGLSTPASRFGSATAFASLSVRSGRLGALAASWLPEAGGCWRSDHGVNTDSFRLIGRESAGQAPDGLAPARLAGSGVEEELAGRSGSPVSSGGNDPDGLSERLGESAFAASPP